MTIEPIALFVLQFLWFLLAGSLITSFLLWRAAVAGRAALRLGGTPMFRVLGVGLLVPNLSPGMPAGSRCRRRPRTR